MLSELHLTLYWPLVTFSTMTPEPFTRHSCGPEGVLQKVQVTVTQLHLHGWDSDGVDVLAGEKTLSPLSPSLWDALRWEWSAPRSLSTSSCSSLPLPVSPVGAHVTPHIPSSRSGVWLDHDWQEGQWLLAAEPSADTYHENFDLTCSCNFSVTNGETSFQRYWDQQS